MRIHILGIGGTFMGGVALLARDLGHEVTGSDAKVYPPMSTQLEAQGIRLMEGYDAAHLDTARPDLVIIGNALSRGNSQVEAVLDRGLRYTSGAQWIAENVLRAAGCSRSRARTARPPPPACWPGSWSTPGSSPAF
jgi:UDP-N-acetylmuramate: L-alanyl-gamma-D-glutamyl-meso-diaminopimelate ligase